MQATKVAVELAGIALAIGLAAAMFIAIPVL
jgi:hypothetical protein